MPMRNSLPYLVEAIDSIVNQTFTDWELVIVDNASTDDSVAYARERAAADTRIHIFENEHNIGVTGSLNRGLSLCRGEWIARMDADDRALPDRFARQIAFLDENEDVIVLSCFAHYIDSKGRRIARGPHDLTSREAYRRYMAERKVIGILHPGAMIKRSEIDAIGGYRTEYEPAEDTDLWNRISERGVVMVLPEFLMEYRLHDTSIVATEMDIAHRKRGWVRVSMEARRDGRPEPTWEETQKIWESAPFLARFERKRQLLVDAMLRRGRQDLAKGRRVRATPSSQPAL
jgi:glycosyltransferase involved in cell wall biosynthesis